MGASFIIGIEERAGLSEEMRSISVGMRSGKSCAPRK